MTAIQSASDRSTKQLTLVALQPSYLPWLGYFDLIQRSDVFVFGDNLQYDRHGWRNRNRIKGPDAEPLWLTVPVHAHLGTPICEVEVVPDERWATKHLKWLRHYYAKAPYLTRYLPDLEATLAAGWDRLADLNIALTQLMCGWMEAQTRFVRASTLEVPAGRNERILAYCRHFGAKRYLSGNSAQAYLDLPLFERHGIEVVWQDYRHPTYPQLHGGFVPFLSAVDLVLNCGERSATIVASGSARGST